ncbi:MAG: DUF4082 domain-containing protein [Bacteroidetes bacterium]|nr:DUF4082 domain-containing protein [Bacteroidota bacterium]
MKKAKTIFSLLIVILFLLTGCQKKPFQTGGRISRVNPFSQYLQDNGNKVDVTLHENDLPVEIGYSFTASDTGTIYEIGIRLPDSGRVYTVTLWDGVTQAPLIQKDIKVNTTTGFSYDDLSSTNEAVHILGNHSYVISVNMTQSGVAGAAGDGFYNARRTDQANIFPLTESYITYQNQYNKITPTPAFPDNLVVYQDFINGLCDIGFSHITN